MPSFLIFTQPKPQRHISRSQLLQHYIVSSTLGQIKASHATNDCNKKGGNWVEVSWKLDNIYKQKSLCSCMKDLLFWHNYTTRKFIRIGPQDEHMPWLFGSSLSWFWHIVFFLSWNERLYPRWRWENRRVWGGRESLLEHELITVFKSWRIYSITICMEETFVHTPHRLRVLIFTQPSTFWMSQLYMLQLIWIISYYRY